VTFQATLKISTSGLQKITIEANNYNHALAMLYSLYGKQNVMNVSQLSK
jgi:hypothetical protein